MRYIAPDSLATAVKLLHAEAGLARVLAGGTDVLAQLKAGMVEPDLLLDIKRIPGLSSIVEEAGGFRIGAAVPSAVLGEHEALRKAWPGVVEAANLIGSTQIQGRATIVGNLCNASPAADSVPALVAAGATARIAGPDGTRDLPAGELAASPGKTSLARGEIVESVFLPARPVRASDAYLRFIPRTEMDIAVVGAGVSLTLDAEGTCKEARVALGAVAPRVVLVEEAAAALVGSRLDEKALAKAAEAASAACRPIDDRRGTREFRIRVAGVLTRRAAVIAYERARASK